MKAINLKSLVILKQKRKVKEDMENECTNTRFEIEEQHLACQVRSILKTKKLSEVEIETLRGKIATLQETVEVLIENDPVEGFDVTPVIEIGVQQNQPAADSGMEGTDELHQNDDTQRI